MKLSHFNISNFKIDGGAMFGVVPKVMWNKVYPADENNLIPLALKSLIVESDGRPLRHPKYLQHHSFSEQLH